MREECLLSLNDEDFESIGLDANDINDEQFEAIVEAAKDVLNENGHFIIAFREAVDRVLTSAKK
jgi:hypothetical protein